MKKLILALMLVLSSLLSGNVYAHDTLSNKQIEAVLLAEDVGAKYDMGELLAAVIGQESSWCANKHGLDRHGYGCGQLHVGTVKDMLGWTVTREALTKHDYLNIYISGDILHSCSIRFADVAHTLYCYNHGRDAAAKVSQHRLSHDKYIRAVLKRLKTVEDLNMIMDGFPFPTVDTYPDGVNTISCPFTSTFVSPVIISKSI